MKKEEKQQFIKALAQIIEDNPEVQIRFSGFVQLEPMDGEDPEEAVTEYPLLPLAFERVWFYVAIDDEGHPISRHIGDEGYEEWARECYEMSRITALNEVDFETWCATHISKREEIEVQFLIPDAY